jgi:hypothetical protein
MPDLLCEPPDGGQHMVRGLSLAAEDGMTMKDNGSQC